MNEPRAIPLRPRDRLFVAITVMLAVLLLPVAFARHPGRARELPCRWGLRMRFPGEVNHPTQWWHWSSGDRYRALLTGAGHAIHGPVEAGVSA